MWQLGLIIRDFVIKFGCSLTVCINTWLLTVNGEHNMILLAMKDKFFYSLSLLKIYNTESNLSGDLGSVYDEKIF